MTLVADSAQLCPAPVTPPPHHTLFASQYKYTSRNGYPVLFLASNKITPFQPPFLPTPLDNRVNITISHSNTLEGVYREPILHIYKEHNLVKWLKYVLCPICDTSVSATIDSFADSMLLVGEWIYRSTRPRGFNRRLDLRADTRDGRR